MKTGSMDMIREGIVALEARVLDLAPPSPSALDWAERSEMKFHDALLAVIGICLSPISRIAYDQQHNGLFNLTECQECGMLKTEDAKTGQQTNQTK